MTRRAPLQTLAQTVLIAILTCTLLPAPALAGQGHSKSQNEKPGRGRSDEQRPTSDDRQNNDWSQGEKQHRGQSGQQRQNYYDEHGNDRKSQQGQSRSPQDAAQQARSQYGGQVLKVQPAGGGYQVRLLQDDGRVVTVPIED